MLLDGARKVFQCDVCRYLASLIAGTVFQSTKLPLTTWLLGIYLISQAKTGLSALALALKRQLGGELPHGLADPPQTNVGNGRPGGARCA